MWKKHDCLPEKYLSEESMKTMVHVIVNITIRKNLTVSGWWYASVYHKWMGTSCKYTTLLNTLFYLWCMLPFIATCIYVLTVVGTDSLLLNIKDTSWMPELKSDPGLYRCGMILDWLGIQLNLDKLNEHLYSPLMFGILTLHLKIGEFKVLSVHYNIFVLGYWILMWDRKLTSVGWSFL